MTDQEDEFRERRKRDKGWRKSAIADGVIADPDQMTHPTAVELGEALHTLNGGPGKMAEARKLLNSVPDHEIMADPTGRLILQFVGADQPGQTSIRPPAARIEKEEE